MIEEQILTERERERDFANLRMLLKTIKKGMQQLQPNCQGTFDLKLSYWLLSERDQTGSVQQDYFWLIGGLKLSGPMHNPCKVFQLSD